MPLSADLLADRLWDGSGAIDSGHTLCVVPLQKAEDVKKRNAAALDLRLGRWFRTMRQTKVTEIQVGDSRNEEGISKEHYVRFNDFFVLHPGEFVIGITLEWLKLPFDLSGYVTGKSSWGRRGLIIETAAGIHPGFTGCLTLELANVGAAPIKLSPGMQICQIFLHPVQNNEHASSTQFVGYRKPGLGHVAKDSTLSALSQEFFSKTSAKK
jgi:dCTP deaminase